MFPNLITTRIFLNFVTGKGGLRLVKCTTYPQKYLFLLQAVEFSKFFAIVKSPQKNTVLLLFPFQQAVKIAFKMLVLNNTIFFKLAQSVNFGDFSGNFSSVLQHGSVSSV